MENLIKLLFTAVGALLLVIAVTSYFGAEAQMKSYNEATYQNSRNKSDDWVQVATTKNEGQGTDQDHHSVSSGSIQLSERSGKEIIDFLSGYVEEDSILVQFMGRQYVAEELTEAIRQVQEDTSYCIVVKPNFCYEITIGSEE